MSNSTNKNKVFPQGRYWILTIPENSWGPHAGLPDGPVYVKGQLEQGEGGFRHWQVLCCFPKKVRMQRVKQVFGKEAHCELSRSEAANEYVWKEETRVAGTSFSWYDASYQVNNFF